MVLVQKWPFFEFFFLGNIGQENVFYAILEPMVLFQIWPLIYLFFWQYRRGKWVLRCCRTKKACVQEVQKSKNWEMAFSYLFLEGNIGQEQVFYDILEGPFYAIKTRSSKSPNIEIFSKGLTHGFGPKLAIFSIFFVKTI